MGCESLEAPLGACLQLLALRIDWLLTGAAQSEHAVIVCTDTDTDSHHHAWGLTRVALEVALEVGVLTQMSSTMLRRGMAVDTWCSGERVVLQNEAVFE